MEKEADVTVLNKRLVVEWAAHVGEILRIFLWGDGLLANKGNPEFLLPFYPEYFSFS